MSSGAGYNKNVKGELKSMDSKEEYISLEIACRRYLPKLNHHAYESILKPDEQFLKIQIGDEVIRTIREEESEIMWYSGKLYLESYMKTFMEGKENERNYQSQ